MTSEAMALIFKALLSFFLQEIIDQNPYDTIASMKGNTAYIINFKYRILDRKIPPYSAESVDTISLFSKKQSIEKI